jgi:four helix bundle protein
MTESKKRNSYKDGHAWQEAVRLCELVHLATSRSADEDEAAMAKTLQLAVMEIPCQIAAGYSLKFYDRWEYLDAVREALAKLVQFETKFTVAKNVELVTGDVEPIEQAIDQLTRYILGMLKNIRLKNLEYDKKVHNEITDIAAEEDLHAEE